MKSIDLIYGAPVVLLNSEPYPVLTGSKQAEDFQNSVERRRAIVGLSNVEKLCKLCAVPKDLSEFSNHPTGILGRAARCKVCRSAVELERLKAKRVK